MCPLPLAIGPGKWNRSGVGVDGVTDPSDRQASLASVTRAGVCTALSRQAYMYCIIRAGCTCIRFYLGRFIQCQCQW